MANIVVAKGEVAPAGHWSGKILDLPEKSGFFKNEPEERMISVKANLRLLPEKYLKCLRATLPFFATKNCL
ncbi:MAG: hypothetical protein HC913_09250 [Microscillaceae bacterium]|nr:hypothetical protein [Microscillaceae bacterium]